MRFELYCPACGVREVEFESYRLAVMLAPNLALMAFECPGCQTPLHVSVKLNRAQQNILKDHQLKSPEADQLPLPAGASAPVSYTALQVVDTGDDFLQILVSPPTSTPEARNRINAFHEQLEQIDSVDDALRRIDDGLSRGHQGDSDAK